MTRQGMVRYNPDKNCMEIYTNPRRNSMALMHSNGWVEVSDYLLHSLELMVLE